MTIVYKNSDYNKLVCVYVTQLPPHTNDVSQFNFIYKYCEMKNYKVVRSYVDENQDQLSKRENFYKMIDEMKTMDNVNTVIIHSIEKTLFDLTEICEVKDNLKRCDITLESVIDGVESGTIEGWFIFSMLSTVAEYKRNIIKQIKEFDKTN